MTDTLPRCWYCRGARSPCVCTDDCGARLDSPPGNSHICGKAPSDVRAEWLRSTGLYTEEEIEGLTSD